MPDVRYALRNGDKTSTGGALVATGKSPMHHNLMVGLEGDHASCPTCGAGGPVMNDCIPSFNVNGKQVLVSGARVYCKCPAHPTVIHSQTTFTIHVNRSGNGKEPAGLAVASLVPTEPREIVEQYFEITGEDGRPLEGYRYDLFSNGTQMVRNRQMTNGRTISMNGEHDVHVVMWLDKSGQEYA